MKKSLIIAIFAACTLSANAQWERPTDNNGSAQQRPRRALIETKKKEPIDAKYLAGAVPEENGKVCWSKTFECKGKTADQIYERAMDVMKELIDDKRQTEKSQIAVINKEQKQIGVRMVEWLVFSNSFLSLDQTLFNYTLVVTCTDGKCEVKMINLSYHYEMDRPTAAVYTAEDMISDKEALNKKKNGFTRGGSKKFRTKTIDRKDEIFEFINTKLAQ